MDTLLDWAQRYRLQGVGGLGPKPRSDRGTSRVLTPELAGMIERLKRENPYRTGATLLRELALCSRERKPPPFRVHPLSLPQSTRLDGPRAAQARARAQEVRGRRPCCMDHPEGCLIMVFFNTGDNLDAT